MFHFGSVRLFSRLHVLCLLFLLKDALLAIPDGDAHVLVSMTADPTHDECTPLSDFMPLCFPSPTPAPLVTGEDNRSAPRAEIRPPPILAAPGSTGLHKHTATCIQAAAMNPMVYPLKRTVEYFTPCA